MLYYPNTQPYVNDNLEYRHIKNQRGSSCGISSVAAIHNKNYGFVL